MTRISQQNALQAQREAQREARRQSDRHCAECGAKVARGVHLCSCGCSSILPYAPAPNRPMAPEDTPRLPWPMQIRVPAPDVVLLFGPPGVGKTSVALAVGGEGAHLLTAEMGPGRVVQYGSRVGAKVSASRIRTEECGDFTATVPADITLLILDSLQAAGNPIQALRWLADLARRAQVPAIAISHVNAEGNPEGRRRLVHEVDHVVEVVPIHDPVREVRVIKTRSGRVPVPVAWQFGVQGEIAPAELPSCYFSVEGPQGGPYLLVSHPHSSRRRPRHAGLLQAAERGGDRAPVLGAPPLAVGALRGGALTGAWVEPPDGPQRSAYARARGVSYRTAKGAIERPGEKTDS